MTTIKFVVEIDVYELAVRMCEAAHRLTRPPGLSAKEAVVAMGAEGAQEWLRAADAARRYLEELARTEGVTVQ